MKDDKCPGCHQQYGEYCYNSGFTVRCPNIECKFFDNEMLQRYLRHLDRCAEEYQDENSRITEDDFVDLFADPRDWR